MTVIRPDRLCLENYLRIIGVTSNLEGSTVLDQNATGEQGFSQNHVLGDPNNPELERQAQIQLLE